MNDDHKLMRHLWGFKVRKITSMDYSWTYRFWKHTRLIKTYSSPPNADAGSNNGPFSVFNDTPLALRSLVQPVDPVRSSDWQFGCCALQSILTLRLKSASVWKHHLNEAALGAARGVRCDRLIYHFLVRRRGGWVGATDQYQWVNGKIEVCWAGGWYQFHLIKHHYYPKGGSSSSVFELRWWESPSPFIISRWAGCCDSHLKWQCVRTKAPTTRALQWSMRRIKKKTFKQHTYTR